MSGLCMVLFHYLGRISDLLCALILSSKNMSLLNGVMPNQVDDADIKREIRNMYSRTNMLRRFGKCSLPVKLCLFRSYCLCLYGTALWSKYNATTLLQLKYCYRKYIKMFFGYAKYHSITDVLLNLRLPSFNTVMHNFRYVFSIQWNSCANNLVVYYRNLHLDFSTLQ